MTVRSILIPKASSRSIVELENTIFESLNPTVRKRIDTNTEFIKLIDWAFSETNITCMSNRKTIEDNIRNQSFLSNSLALGSFVISTSLKDDIIKKQNYVTIFLLIVPNNLVFIFYYIYGHFLNVSTLSCQNLKAGRRARLRSEPYMLNSSSSFWR